MHRAMSIDEPQISRRKAGELVRRHVRQIGSRPFEEHQALTEVYAIGFLPAERNTTSFKQSLQPVGTAMMNVLSYGVRGKKRGRKPSLPFRGFRAQAQVDGSVIYGGAAGHSFRFEGSVAPRLTHWPEVLKPDRHAHLIGMLHRLDHECQRQLYRRKRPPLVPKLPRILLGFEPGQPPVFEDTPALRRLAAAQLGVPVEQLGQNGDLLLQRLLEDTWAKQLVPADAAGNSTGLVLIDAEFCSQARASLRAFEDFSDLLGFPTWNPARLLTQHFQVHNPAAAVIQELNIDTSDDFAQPIPQDQIDHLLRRMRATVGPVEAEFTDEELLDGVMTPHLPITAWSKSLSDMRAQLQPHVNECASDDDLLRAARRPNEPLFASGGCRIQVLRRLTPIDQEAFSFSPEVLERKATVNLWVDWSRSPPACAGV